MHISKIPNRGRGGPPRIRNSSKDRVEKNTKCFFPRLSFLCIRTLNKDRMEKHFVFFHVYLFSVYIYTPLPYVYIHTLPNTFINTVGVEDNHP